MLGEGIRVDLAGVDDGDFCRGVCCSVELFIGLLLASRRSQPLSENLAQLRQQGVLRGLGQLCPKLFQRDRGRWLDQIGRWARGGRRDCMLSLLARGEC